MQLKLLLGLIVWMIASTAAQSGPFGGSHVALVVGSGRYDHVPPLAHSAADSRAIAGRLAELGYAVTLLEDPNEAELLRALAHMRITAAQASQVVVYLAGHGFQHGQSAYFLTREIDPRTFGQQPGRPAGAVPLPVFLQTFSDKPRQKIIFFDACRTPAEIFRGWKAAGAQRPPAAGALIAYSAAMGAASFDGAGANSPFAAGLLRQLRDPARPLGEILRAVRLDVVRQTGGTQVPWVRSSLLQEAWIGASPQQQLLRQGDRWRP